MPAGRSTSLRPIDFIDGPWPDGHIRAPAGTDEGAVYVAEQVINLVRAIIERREQRGLRRSQVAAMTGLRANTVSDLENGLAWPDLRTVARLAWVLEADIEWVPRHAVKRRE